MLLNITLISAIVISLGVIIFIIGRKFPKLKTLDVDTVPQAQTAKVRDRILLERMKRTTKKSKEAVRKQAVPFLNKFTNIIKKIIEKVYALEKKYQKQATEKNPLSAKESKTQVADLLTKAQSFIKKEKWNDAEKLLIEVVSLDSKNKDAYQGLFDVYFSTKEYKQALQTAQFILRLVQKGSQRVEKQDKVGQKYYTVSNAPELADVYMEMGEVYRRMEKPELALVNYQKALEVEPNNPRNLDQTIEICIRQKHKSLAFDLIKRLEEVNPENQKLKDYYDKLSNL